MSRNLLLFFLGLFFAPSLLAQESTETPAPEPTVQTVQTAPAEPWVSITANRGKKDWPDNPVVYLIPVRQEIMQPQLFLLRRGVQQALKGGADAIVLLMDTPGGRIDIMKEMTSMVIDLDIPTYTLVEGPKYGAISAGAILALSTDYIYMQPRTNIGDAMPVMIGPNGYETMGDAEREKSETYMDAVVRSIAQAKGRDEMMIRSMVRRNLEYKLEDGRTVSPKGSILTLTNNEATRINDKGEPLVSEGTVEDLESFLSMVGLENATLTELEPTWPDHLALMITRAAPILMMLAMLLVYLEIQSPGIGWAGGGALILFILVFFGHNVAGLAGMEDLVLIGLGVVLILLEIFIIPGFGIAGISGILLLIWGLIQSMTIRYPGNPGELPGLENVGNLGPAITSLGVSVIGAAVLAGILLKSMGEKSLLGRKLVLAESLHDEVLSSLSELVGRNGTVLTPLRPSGTVTVDGKDYDAISDGEYIDSQQTVQVQEVHNHRLRVTTVQEPPA